MNQINDLTVFVPYFPEWKVECDENGYYLKLVHPTEAQLIFRIKGDRLLIRASYFLNGISLFPYATVQERRKLKDQISCSRWRTAQSIAKDAHRRLLPEYLDTFARCQKRYLQQADEVAQAA